MGSIIPSIMTILGNAISLRWIITIRRSVNEQSRLSQRRTEDTRRVVFIITIECLLAIISSWFIDIILSIKYCGSLLAVGDDCPNFLIHSNFLIGVSDLVNSVSNIILYSFSGRRFRHELKRMFDSWIHTIKKRIPCYCRIEWKQSVQLARRYDDENEVPPSDSSSKQSKTLKNPSKKETQYIKLRVITYPTSVP